MGGVALVALVALGAADPGGAPLEFRDAELSAVVEAVGAFSGRTILLDPGVSGRITLSAPAVQGEEALELLRAALQLSGFALVPAPAGALKVLPLPAAPPETPGLVGEAHAGSDRLAVALLRLENARASDLATALGSNDERGSRVIAYPPTNSLIIAAAESRLLRLRWLVRALDRGERGEVRVLPLSHASAQDAALQIRAAFPDDGALEPRYRLVADERTNSLVIAAPHERIAEIARFAELLDVERGGKPDLHVVRLRNADAEVLAGELLALADPNAQARIVADAPTNSLVIMASVSEFGALRALIDELDRVPGRAAIDVAVWTVVTTDSLDLGFDGLVPFLIPDAFGDPAGVATVGDASTFFEPTPSSIPLVARLTADSVAIPVLDPLGNVVDVLVPKAAGQITAAAGRTVLRTLSHPQLLVTNGEEHRIFGGDEVPVPVTTGTGGAQTATDPNTGTTSPAGLGGFVTSTNIERQPVGVDLRVKPTVITSDVVALDLQVSLKQVVESAESSLGPTIRQIDVEASVRVPNGGVLLLAANPNDQSTRSVVGVPWLKDVPILGFMFRTTRDEIRQQRLLIAVQAVSIDSLEEQRTDSLQRRLAFERVLAAPDLDNLRHALLVATRTTREEADAVAQELVGRAPALRIVEWSWRGQPRFDVYALGFETVGDAGPLAAELRSQGYRPGFVVSQR
jgi:general secretion pathway protein D